MKKFTSYTLLSFLLFTALSASAQWTLVENFNSLTDGALHGQNSWTTGTGTGASNFTSGTTSDVAIAADPANASNFYQSVVHIEEHIKVCLRQLLAVFIPFFTE